jgi:zinc/manganese transport system permease protein
LLIAWRILRTSQSHFAFYGLFALAVTASVQLVGIYLVFASLIVPALATYRLQSQRMVYAAVVGIAGYALGLLFSVWFDLPAGVTIVCAMAVIGLLVAIIKRPD